MHIVLCIAYIVCVYTKMHVECIQYIIHVQWAVSLVSKSHTKHGLWNTNVCIYMKKRQVEKKWIWVFCFVSYVNECSIIVTHSLTWNKVYIRNQEEYIWTTVHYYWAEKTVENETHTKKNYSHKIDNCGDEMKSKELNVTTITIKTKPNNKL